MKQKLSYRLLLPGAAAVLVLAAVLALVLCRHPEAPPDPSAGVAYLQGLEQQDPAAVEDTLKAIRRAELQAMHDQRLAQLQSGELSVWSMFQDYVVLGDSRTCGFFFDSYLDQSRVLAAYGDTIRQIDGHIPEIQQLNPAYIFLCYGLNDMVQEGWETPELYADAYRQTVTKLQSAFPDAKIYINSIFPVRDPAFERWEKWRQSQDYSDAVETMCAETGCYFIANENLQNSLDEYWQEDGIHFYSDFYPLWATNMIMEVYDSELETLEDPAA